MEHVNVPSDRYSAHVFLSEQYSEPGAERNFQWRLFQRRGKSLAAVRRFDESIIVPDEGAIVRFEIESIALVRTKGKRHYLRDERSRMSFIVGTLLTNAGLRVDISTVTITDAPGYIENSTQRFSKPAAIFQGTAEVSNTKLLEHALRAGLGQGKAYGYGMLIVEEIA